MAEIIVDLSGVRFVYIPSSIPVCPLTSLHRYLARIDRVYPPKFADSKIRDSYKNMPSSALEAEELHVVGSDLKTPLEETIQRDNPEGYYYWCYLLELEKDKSHEKGKGKSADMHKDGKLVGSLVEVRSPMMR